MDKNRVRRLAENPYYSMNDKELEQLAQMLREEAESERAEEAKKETETEKPRKGINKNRVTKTIPTVEKTPVLEEQDDVSV